MALKEKDIVNHLYLNWNKYFPELIGCMKEYTFRNSRVDLFSSCPVDLYELGIREENDKFRYINASVFAEVKYNNNDRDLLFELQKHISFRDWYVKYGKAFCFIMVIADDFDYEMVKFMEANDILMYKYTIENDDLDTLTIEEYTVENIKFKEIISC